MIYDSNALPLFEEWKKAREQENIAVDALLSSLKSGNRDTAILGALTTQMENTHKKAMDIYDQLQKFRLDS